MRLFAFPFSRSCSSVSKSADVSVAELCLTEKIINDR